MSSDTPVSAEARERILRRFEAWLDETLAAEDPPRGIAAEILAELDGREEAPFHDFYSMWAAITALTQEVRLQGRAFKQLAELLDRTERPERERAIEREAERRAHKQVLDALLDLRDRVGRGLESARAFLGHDHSDGRLARWFARRAIARRDEAVAALEKGYRLGLERLDEALGELEVRPLHCEGQPFDPRSMNAVDLEQTDAVAEGTVLEVYRTGYEWRGEVYRAAQVKVARAREEEDE